MTDTNAVIDYLGKKLPDPGMEFMNDIIDAIPNVSVITQIEVLGFNAPHKHYKLLASFMNDANILDLTSDITNVLLKFETRHIYC